VRFARGNIMSEDALKALATQHGFDVANITYRLREDSGQFEYEMILRTLDRNASRTLASALRDLDSVIGFQITPTGT
jgi:putative Mg2+ transporter-C (MgtC) family protein